MITSKIQRVTKVFLCFQILYIFQRFLYHDDFEEKTTGLIGKIEDTKEIIRSRKLKKDRQHNGQQEKEIRTKTAYKTLHRKLKIEQHEPH
jgi:hypothetical protein